MLDGSGSITLDGSNASIVGESAGSTLNNVGNTISGSGHIGLDGNGLLSLVNSGTVEATAGNLVIDTGHTVVNNGTLEANGATLTVDDPVSGSGEVLITNGGTAIFQGAVGGQVIFTGVFGGLVLDHPDSFTGTISGFTGTAPDAAHSDTIDLVGINLNSTQFRRTYNASKGVLTVTDGSDTAHLNFTGFNGKLDFASDGNGGTLITDPPVTNSMAGPRSGLSAADATSRWIEQRCRHPTAACRRAWRRSDRLSIIGGKATNVFQQANFTETNLNTNQPSTPLSEHAGDHNTQLADSCEP